MQGAASPTSTWNSKPLERQPTQFLASPPRDTYIRAMPRSFPPTAAPAPEDLFASTLEQGWDAAHPIGEGNARAALVASPPGFLPGSSIHDVDLDAYAGSGTLDPAAASKRFVSLRGAVLAPGQRPTVSHPSTEGPGDIRCFQASAVLPRGTFSLRG